MVYLLHKRIQKDTRICKCFKSNSFSLLFFIQWCEYDSDLKELNNKQNENIKWKVFKVLKTTIFKEFLIVFYFYVVVFNCLSNRSLNSFFKFKCLVKNTNKQPLKQFSLSECACVCFQRIKRKWIFYFSFHESFGPL